MFRSSAPRLRAGLAALLVALAPGWAPAAGSALPDLGDSSARMLGPQAERAIGRQVMRQLHSSGSYFSDPEVNAYLDALGHRLVAGDADLHGDFEFFAVGAPEINAFALPGGYVGVNTGLILATESESELASVLAHEITHVTQHHIARQMEAQSASQLAMLAGLAAAILAGASGNDQAAQAAVTGATAGAMQNQINYTRDFEREADRIGFQLLEKAGFDARAMASFFQRLQQATRLQDNKTPGYLRTHPLTYERVAEAQDRAFSSPYKQVRDSLEYQLVRALLKSYQGIPDEAVAALRKQLDTPRTEARNAARYGLAAAQLRAAKFPEAMAEVQALDKAGFRHPMVEALAGQILLQSGQYAAARSRYETALARYPDHLQLVYDYPRNLIKARDFNTAARFTEAQLSQRRNDSTLHELAAEAHSGVGHQTLSHYHLGEMYALRGDTREAIQQMEIATRAQDGGEQAQALAEGRLIALRKQRRDERRDKDGMGGSGTGYLDVAPTRPTHRESGPLPSFTKP
jgi:beta-barrel assembly-enhancing protease